jgi:cold shock protein
LRFATSGLGLRGAETGRFKTWLLVLLSGSTPPRVYGFIQPDNGGKDVFVHISAVEKAGLSNLNEGAKVSYEVVANRGKESAENLRVG